MLVLAATSLAVTRTNSGDNRKAGHVSLQIVLVAAVLLLLKDKLKERFEALSQAHTEESSIPKDVEVFESVLGPQRGYYRGIGLKPSSSASASFNIGHAQEQGQTAPALTLMVRYGPVRYLDANTLD
ncbi:hypothetical protein QVD17_08378 [Tagetes erecta]|uniref:Uncharacterized protein n=1 Tax=Tagetes erecta TaxID=13708 RepID=A0AAD8KZF3_TARER|nr:hypothetical protein QVD17_08378 [Tagetes erecta]